MAVILTDMQTPPQCCCLCPFHFRINNTSTACSRKPAEEPVEDGDERPEYCPLKEVNFNHKKIVEGLEWVLEDDRFGFGINWETGEPRDDHEKAGKIIADTITMLKELEEY